LSQHQRVQALLALQGDHDIEDFLLTADLELAPDSIGTTNKVYVASREGRAVAAFKPHSGLSMNTARIYGHTRNSVLIAEAVAWQVAKGLGPPFSELVTPCILRKLDGKEGALATWQPGTSPDNRVFSRVPDDCNTAALFDAIIGQQDRNDYNYLWDDDEGRLALIDHGYSFARPGDRRNLSRFCAWRHQSGGGDALANEERFALEQFAGPSGALASIEECLEPARARCLRARVESMCDTGILLRPLVMDPARAS
jgi:hypothetical protein